MTQRITKKTLQARIDMLNDMFGYSKDAWTKNTDGQFRANPNTYILDCVYGGYRLGQICNDGGGARDISPRGTARETYEFINAFIAGVNTAKEAA